MKQVRVTTRSHWYGPYAGGIAVDPQGPPTSFGRVIRGGNWDDNAMGCRAAVRGGIDPMDFSFKIGFRVVLALGQP